MALSNRSTTITRLTTNTIKIDKLRKAVMSRRQFGADLFGVAMDSMNALWSSMDFRAAVTPSSKRFNRGCCPQAAHKAAPMTKVANRG